MFGRTDPRLAELKTMPVFASCSPQEVGRIARLSDDVRLPARTVLTREGSIGHECFIVRDGEATVTLRSEEIARLRPGDIVGEMALLDHEPRSATVVARTPLRALVMTNLQFAAVTDHCPTIARKVMRALAQRLREVQAA